MKVLLYGAILLVALIPAKVQIWKIADETDARVIWRDSLLLFLTFTLVMGAALYVVCADAPSAQVCVQRMLVTFLIGSFIALISGTICYCVKQKRGLSQMDRMKLQDM